MGSRFHYRDGWYFERLEDGSVRITHPDGWIDDKTQAHEDFDIDPASWASIVAHVSKLGETAESYQHTIAAHQGDIS